MMMILPLLIITLLFDEASASVPPPKQQVEYESYTNDDVQVASNAVLPRIIALKKNRTSSLTTPIPSSTEVLSAWPTLPSMSTTANVTDDDTTATSSSSPLATRLDDVKQLLFASYASYECQESLNANNCFWCEAMDPPLRFVRTLGRPLGVTQAYIGWQAPSPSWTKGSPHDESSGRVVVAFRGTADVQSLLADLAVRKVVPAEQLRAVNALAGDLEAIASMQGLSKEASEVLRRSAAADVVLDRFKQVSAAMAAGTFNDSDVKANEAKSTTKYAPCEGCAFHDGFWRGFLEVAAADTTGNFTRGLYYQIADVMRDGLREIRGNNNSSSVDIEEEAFPADLTLPTVAFTGHSLGAAVATIAAVAAATLFAPLGINGLRQPKVRAVTFGAPRFCNRNAADYIENRLPLLGSDLHVERYVNDHDIVPNLLPKGLVGLRRRSTLLQIVAALAAPVNELIPALSRLMVFNANEGYRHTGTEYWIHDFYENQRNATATIPYPYTFPAPTFDDGTPYMCGAENVTHPISPQSVAISTCESARDGGCQSPALYPLLMIASDPNATEDLQNTTATAWARWAGCFSAFIVGSSLRAGIPPIAPWPGITPVDTWPVVEAERQAEVRSYDPRAGAPLPACVRNHEQYLGFSLTGCPFPRTSLCGQRPGTGASPLDWTAAIRNIPGLIAQTVGVAVSARSGR